MASTVLYGMLAAFAVQTSTDWRRRVVAVFMAASLIALVCFSRIHLGVHYLSDVLAGIAEGVAWLALCLIAVDMLERHTLRAALFGLCENRCLTELPSSSTFPLVLMIRKQWRII